jgi:putative N-acetyltransferase (TIGR04045 family)
VGASSSPSPLVDAPPAPAAAGLGCRLARDAEELAAHFAVRRAIFVEAQRLFERDDRDAHDDDPATLHAVGLAGGDVAGAVRLYPLDAAGRWKGDRLAVLPGSRQHRLGAELVRFAVATAGARGGDVMEAQIQLANVAFFLRLGWRADGAVADMLGVPHQPMAIGLTVPGR